MPLEAAAERNSACNFALPVTRFAPGSASASRMMLKVCDPIIKLMRASRRSLEMSSREMPIPDTWCDGVNWSAPPAGVSAQRASRRPYLEFM